MIVDQKTKVYFNEFDFGYIDAVIQIMGNNGQTCLRTFLGQSAPTKGSRISESISLMKKGGVRSALITTM